MKGLCTSNVVQISIAIGKGYRVLIKDGPNFEPKEIVKMLQEEKEGAAEFLLYFVEGVANEKHT